MTPGTCNARGAGSCAESRFDPTACAYCGGTVGDGSLAGIDFPALVCGAAAAHLWADAIVEGGESADIASETAVYLAERLADEDLAPWTESAIATVVDVLDWAKANADDVHDYMRATERDACHVGHDFALSRSGHGTGLWDRGAGDVGKRLHDAARVYGSVTLLVTLDPDDDVVRVDA